MRTSGTVKVLLAIADDIQICGTESTHDLHLHEAMERTRKAGLKTEL